MMVVVCMRRVREGMHAGACEWLWQHLLSLVVSLELAGYKPGAWAST